MSLQLLRRTAPLALFVLALALFAYGLTRNPSAIPSELIDRPAPEFDLPPIADYERGLSTADLRGEISLLNVFASWCPPCAIEHPYLVQIAEAGGPPIYGLAWKDQPGATTQWLSRRDDPYEAIGDDASGRVAIDFGVAGAPETFIIDAEGRIRYRHVGPINPQIWRTVFEPRLEALRAE
ncbi:MAG: DsbE family thiol:disulfide interchange protein [Maricaulaceae bacterium]|jgi:cytochrome c biogenesis protein CcmG/thiol:disulfide interchange protein DsbE